MNVELLCDLHLDESKDHHDAEDQIVEALPKLAESASSLDLRQAFSDHLEKTRGHVARLSQIVAGRGFTSNQEGAS